MSKLSFLGRGKAHGRGRNSRPLHPANDSHLSRSSPLVIPTGAPKERSGGICSAPRGSLKSFLGSDPEQPSSPHQTAASLLTYPQQQSCGVGLISLDNLLLRLDGSSEPISQVTNPPIAWDSTRFFQGIPVWSPFYASFTRKPDLSAPSNNSSISSSDFPFVSGRRKAAMRK